MLMNMGEENPFRERAKRSVKRKVSLAGREALAVGPASLGGARITGRG